MFGHWLGAVCSLMLQLMDEISQAMEERGNVLDKVEVNVVTSDLKLSTEDVLNSGDEDEQIFVNVRDKRPVSSQTMSASNISDVDTYITRNQGFMAHLIDHRSHDKM